MIRRSPAEFYIRYRILKDPAKSDKDLIKDLMSELVFVPNEAYLKDLRVEMTPPPGFKPEMLGHAQSQFFLTSRGIWSMFYPGPATREAKRVFDDVRTRSMLQTLICGPNIDEIVRDAFLRKSTLPLSEAGLKEFKHYFWNIDLLSPPELVEYIKSFLKDYRMSDAARMPVSPNAIQSTLHEVGVNPGAIDNSEAVLWYKHAFLALLPKQELMQVGPGQSIAMRNGFESFAECCRVEKELARESGETMEEARKFSAVTHDTEIIDLLDMGKGKVPLPVALLRSPDDNELVEEESK